MEPKLVDEKSVDLGFMFCVKEITSNVIISTRNIIMPELSMYFTKASLHEDGTRHWAATVSDTRPDNHGQRVDKAFFPYAIDQSKVYGMPNLCISHYDFAGKDIPEEIWKAGITSAMFLDGNKFKAKGRFFDSRAGQLLFDAIRKDMEENISREDRTRISMGFYDRTDDEEKSEATGDGDERRVVYKAGIIKHFAGTRVPVLPRTEIEAWREMSMTTKREDATSIVGEELAEELEGYAKQVGKSEAEELVVKATEEEQVQEMVEKKAETVEKARGEGKGVGGPAQGDGGADRCICPSCDATAPHEKGTPCAKVNCPKCGTAMQGGPAEKAELVEQMIKDEDGEVVLYSKDGSKVLGRFPYGEGKKYADKEAAKVAAQKREGQVKFFKGEKKSETEEKCEVVGGTEVEEEVVEEAELEEKAKKGKGWTPPPKGWTKASLDKYWASMGGSVTSCMARAEGHVSDEAKFCASLKDKVTGTTKWRGPHKKKSDAEVTLADFEEWLYSEVEEQSGAVEKAGRRLNTQQLEKFKNTRQRVEELLADMQEFEDWAATVPEKITGTETAGEPLEENPAIPILEQGTPMTPVYAANFDDKMQEFAENVYVGVTDGNVENIQDSLNMIAEAIKAELETSIPESISKAESEVGVEAEEVKTTVTPLDAFNMKAKAVLHSEELDRRAKLQSLQSSLNEVGGWLQKSVVENTPPSMGDIREVIVAAVREGTKPLAQENATLKARIEELEQRGQQELQVPVRKSIYEAEVLPEQSKDSFTAKEVARMTMPQGVFY